MRLLFWIWLSLTLLTGLNTHRHLISPLQTIHPEWALFSTLSMACLLLYLVFRKSKARSQKNFGWILFWMGGAFLTGMAGFMGFLPLFFHQAIVFGGVALLLIGGFKSR